MRDLTNGICGILRHGDGSRLYGSRHDNAHLWFYRNSCVAACQSSEHAARNFAIRGSDVPCASGSSGTAI